MSTLTITGTSGAQTSSTTVPLTMATPSFTLSTSPSVSLSPGTYATTYVYLNASNGFDGNVNLPVAGLPASVTASFAQNPISGSTILTLTAGATAALGTSNLTVSGSSGALKTSTPIALSINPPSFAVGAYSSPVVGLGSSTTDWVSIS